MSYPKHLAEKKWNESTVKDSTVDDLANVLITLDGLGQEKKRKALIELLHRASMDDMDVWDWTTPQEAQEAQEKVENKS